MVLQANYGALEFNWLLGHDIVQKKAEARWGSGVVNQLSLDLRNAYPDVKGFSSRNLYYMKEWYEFYMADDKHREILHQLGAEIVSTWRISSILNEGGMLSLGLYLGSTTCCSYPNANLSKRRFTIWRVQ